MRLSMIRTGIVAVGAAIAFAACGGHAIVPSQSGNTPFAVPQATPNPCTRANTYLFANCKAFTLTKTGGIYPLKAWKGITFKATIGSNTASGTVKFDLGDATGAGDITPPAGFPAFPKYSATKCTSKGGCPGKSLIYFEAINTSAATINITGTSKLYVAATTFPTGATSCFPALLNSSGKWTGYAQVAAQITNKTVTITIPPVGLFVLPPGAAYGALACM